MAKISIDLNTGSIEKSDAVIGIDLGTTNSLIASIQESDRTPYCITKGNDTIVPSAIHFGDEGISVGHEALDHLLTEPENTIYSVKRLMGKSYADIIAKEHGYNYEIIDEEDRLVKVKVHGSTYTPIELSSVILKELKRVAEAQLNKKVHKVVITVPAYFNDAQRQATRDAGKLAGMDVLRIINEPTAASLAYGIGNESESPKTVAVYDLGGGTFDISILNIHQGIYEVLATNGDTYLGGDDIDNAIIQHWTNEHQLTDLRKQDQQLLRVTAERGKKALSHDQQFSTTIDLAGTKHVLELSLVQLNQLIAPLIERTMDCCNNALNDADLTAKEIDEVVLVGGSTRNLAVKDAVAQLFNVAHVNDNINPDEVVALGAAIEADILSGNRKDMLLLDVTPLSLGIETLGGTMDVLIPRNNKIPTKLRKQYTTSVDGQVNLLIKVFQGEREMVEDNRKLGEFIMKGIPAMPAGLPQIEVTFMLNADGILEVSAEETRSGTKQVVQMKPQYGLSDQDIQKMLTDSIVHAQDDMDKRALAESVTEAQQLIYALEKFLVEHKALIEDADSDAINVKMKELRTAIDAKTHQNIVNLTDELNTLSKKYAEIVMDQSIAKALQGKKIE